MNPDLLSRLGGDNAYAEVADDLWRRAAADPLTTSFFDRYDTDRIRSYALRVVEAACDRTSETPTMSGTTQLGSTIDPATFDLLVDLLVAVLRDRDVPDEIINAAVDRVGRLRTAAVRLIPTPVVNPLPAVPGDLERPGLTTSGPNLKMFLHLTSIRTVWSSIARAHPDCELTNGPGYFSLRFPSHPEFESLALFDTAGIDSGLEQIADRSNRSAWTHDPTVGEVLAGRGFTAGRRGTAMSRELGDLKPAGDTPYEVEQVDPMIIGSGAGLPADVITPVAGVMAFATVDGAAGTLMFRAGTDIVVSSLSTRPEARREGRATAVLRYGLLQAKRHGVRTATLQSPDETLGFFGLLGFEPVATWQQWVAPTSD